MSEYIDREAVVKSIIEMYEYEFPTGSGAFDEFITRLIPQTIKNLPIANVATVAHERWNKCVVRGLGRSKTTILLCSRCSSRNDTMIRFNYCPNCGAKMDGGVSNDPE